MMWRGKGGGREREGKGGEEEGKWEGRRKRGRKGRKEEERGLTRMKSFH